jgi:hypothetical protein
MSDKNSDLLILNNSVIVSSEMLRPDVFNAPGLGTHPIGVSTLEILESLLEILLKLTH